MEKELDDYEGKGSGWSLNHIYGAFIRLNKFVPLKAPSGGYIPIPKSVENKKAVINVHNLKDFECFKYSVLTPLVKTEPTDVKSYIGLTHRYVFDTIHFPTPIKDVEKFEKINNISINLYTLDGDECVYPLKVVGEEKTDHRDLLVIATNSGEEKPNFHYCCITDLSRLVSNQITNHDGKLFFCRSCFSHYANRGRLEEHKRLCNQRDAIRIKLPPPGTKVEFKNFSRAMRIPFVIYADFECLLEPVTGCDNDSTSSSFTRPVQNHTLMSFCLYIKCSIDYEDCFLDNTTNPFTYTGPDASKIFFERLNTLGDEIAQEYKKIRPMIPLTVEQNKLWHESSVCYLCGGEMTHSDKVRDHDHLTGYYSGPAHRACNLNFKYPHFIPVFFHNLSGYDSHFIVRELGYDEKDVFVIPNSEEKYISFSKRMGNGLSLRFVDTFRFMSSSLNNLVSYLPDEEKRETLSTFADATPEQRKLLLRKGIYPYEYTDSWARLEETRLPPREAFYSHLSEAGVSEEDYDHACTVWSSFNLTTLREYAELYLQVDVLLLADVFENFRTVCLSNYGLDPSWYFTAPGLFWDAMLKVSKISLDLISDYDMLMMVEEGVRGGITQCVGRYAKADNPYVNTTEGGGCRGEDNTYLFYLDATNLYGWSMSQTLPTGSFQWVTEEEELSSILRRSCDDGVGYILDVDVSYPQHLHDAHKDFPLLVENKKPPPTGKWKKLLAHLGDRRHYIVHYSILKQAVEMGLIIVKIHRAIKFEQSAWCKVYIDLNTEKRKLATNDFEKNFYKLANNAVFGKSMENLRNRMNMSIVTNPKKLMKMVCKPNFLSRTIIAENVVIVHMKKEEILFDKPIYVGMCILDISKILMYDFHYGTMLKLYGPDRLTLLYQDTDSLLYRIKTTDVYKDILERGILRDALDTSDYPENHPCFSLKNKKVLGKFKDELAGVPLAEFVGLRPKMYAVRSMDGYERKKVKGVKTSAVTHRVTFNDYLETLNKGVDSYITFHSIQSKHHTVSTVRQNKLVLTSNDDKRYILPTDPTQTLPYGHYNCPLSVSL